MGLEELREEIVEKANKGAEKIAASASDEASQVVQRVKKEIEERHKKGLSDAEREAKNLERRELAMANFEVNKKLLAKKEETINRAFEQAVVRIRNLSSEVNTRYVSQLLERASKQMEISMLYTNKKDKDAVKNYSWLATEIIGGIIAENKDKTVRIDYSYDTMLENIKNRHIGELAKLLFK